MDQGKIIQDEELNIDDYLVDVKQWSHWNTDHHHRGELERGADWGVDGGVVSISDILMTRLLVSCCCQHGSMVSRVQSSGTYLGRVLRLE